MVEAVVANLVGLEEQEVEKRGQSAIVGRLIEPELGLFQHVVAVEALDRPGLAEEDVVAAAVGAPPRKKALSTENVVGEVEPPVVLVAKLVRGRGAVGIPSRPERGDEAPALLVGRER